MWRCCLSAHLKSVIDEREVPTPFEGHWLNISMYTLGDKCDQPFIGPLLHIVRKENRALAYDAFPFPQFEQNRNLAEPVKLLDVHVSVRFDRTC